MSRTNRILLCMMVIIIAMMIEDNSVRAIVVPTTNIKNNPFKLPDFGDIGDDVNFETLLPEAVDDGVGDVDDDPEKNIPKVLETTVKAVALIGNGRTNGILHLEQTGNGPTRVYGTIQGLSPGGKHGIHVHEYKSTSGDCYSTGEHYNPTASNHGSPETLDSHVGDLGNIQADNRGVAHVDVESDRLSLTGKFSVINRAIVVHYNTDDLGQNPNTESKLNGNSGGRIACGNIRFVSLEK